MNYSEIFSKLDVRAQGYLLAEQIKGFCEQCFFCTLDSRRVEETILRVCGHRHCTLEHLREVISEVIKLIRLEHNIRWEFKLLDNEGSGRISLSDALFLFKTAQGNSFSLAGWQLFLSQRSNITCDYVTSDELVQALLASTGSTDARMATSFDDYMSNKQELSRRSLERKQAIYSGLQKIVAADDDNDDNDDDEDEDEDDNEVTIATPDMSLIDKARERLDNIKKNGLNAFNFKLPKDSEDSLCEDDEISAVDTVSHTVKEHEVDDDLHIVPEQSDLAKKDTLKNTINKLVLTIYKCLAEKLLADLVICNHADFPRVESLHSDYSQLLSKLPNDLSQIEEFSVEEKWTKALEALFTQCDVPIYCLAVVETDHKLLEIFDNKLACTEKFTKLVNWLGRSCSQELTTVEGLLPQNCDLAAIHKTVLQFCYIKNAVQWEADFTSALLMSKLLQVSFREQIFISQHKESSTLNLLHMLLASARISSPGSSGTVTSLYLPHHVLPEEMTEYLPNMVLELVTHKGHLNCRDFIRLLKSRGLNQSLRNCSTHSIDSALMRYKKLKELNFESSNKSTFYHSSDIIDNDILMEGLAVYCHLLLTYTKRNTGTSCFVDVMTKMLANVQKLQINKMFTVLDKVCDGQEADLGNFSEVAVSTQHYFVSLISEVVFPSEDILIAQFYDTSVYTEVIMGIKALYMTLLRCLLWHTFEASSLQIKFSLPSKHLLLIFVMEFSCVKTTSIDVIFPAPIKGSLITRYFELIKNFCSERVVALEEVQVLVHFKQKQFSTLQELISDFYAANKEESTLLQVSKAYRTIYQCMELEISLFRSAEKSKGHVTLSNELGAAMVVGLLHTQHQEINNETDPNISLCLLAQGLYLRHFDGSDYKCEAPLLQCFLACSLLNKPLKMTRDCVGLDNEFEPLVFSSHAHVSKCKALLGTVKEQSYHSINLLQSTLLHMKCDQSNDDVEMQLNQIFFLTTELYYQKKLTNQIKELIGDQIYFQCLLARQNYDISPTDEKWLVLFWLITLLDQKQWNLFAFVASKAIKEIDHTLKRLIKHYHKTDSLLVTLCQIPTCKCVTFQYLDVTKSCVVSALHCKYNVIMSKLPHLPVQSDSYSNLLVQTEWLAKFWFMQSSGKLEQLGGSEVVALTHPWEQLTHAEGKESNKFSCTVKEVTSVLEGMFSLELEQILEQAKLTDQNKMVFFRHQILRINWEQGNLKRMVSFETSWILLNILKSLWTSNIKSECKDQLYKLAQLKLHGHKLTATDETRASSNLSSMIMYMEKLVRTAKKSGMSIDDCTATFGDFFLHIPEAVVKEMIKKHEVEEEMFLMLCGTICETQITEVTDEDNNTLEKLKMDRQQWRLSADVVGAETQDFTSTITGVLILDEHHIKKREAHVKLLQKAMIINLTDAWKQSTEQDSQRSFHNKMVELLVHLLQVQLEEAHGTLGKLSRMTAKSQRALYNEYRMALVQCWLDNIAAVLLDIDPVQNRLMSKAMRLNLQQGREKLQRKKDNSIKARKSAMRVKQRASLSPYASEDECGSTSSLLSALEDDSPQEINQTSMPELSFQAQLKMMAEIEKKFQSEKMKILLQLEEQQNKMESPSKPQRPSLLTTTSKIEGSHQHLRDRAKSAGALKMKERMKQRKRQKLTRIETQLDYDASVDDTQGDQTSTDETITKLNQLEKLYEEKKKMLLSSIQ